MDPSSKDQEPCESKESAVNNSENASFILGTGKLVTPQKNLTEAAPNFCTSDAFKSPLNFSTVTVEQLGITPESFVKNSAGKSSSYLKKFRRRSAVGTRGSPETNHLIRFIAQQRNLKNAEKSPLERSWCSPLQGSPGPYRNVSSLRERISAFRSAFHPIKENKKLSHCPEFSETEAEKEHLGEYQQYGSSTNSSKRRRISSQSKSTDPFSTLDGKATEDVQELTAGTPRRHASAAAAGLEKSSALGFAQSGFAVEESVFVQVLTEASGGRVVADGVEENAVPLDGLLAGVSARTCPDVTSPSMPVCTEDTLLPQASVLRSVLKKPVNPLPESRQEHHHSLCNHGPRPRFVSSPSSCCKEQKADEDACKVLAPHTTRKRKRVTFGEDLSPEVFDESLPANTPLRKGGTPARQKDLSSISPQPSDLSPVPEQLLQPNFDDKEENLENIEPLPVSLPVLSPNKSSPCEAVSGTETFISSNNPEKTSSHKVNRVTRTSNRRKQSNICNLENMETPPCREKKTNKRKSQETKCTNKTVPKKNQVGKSCRRKKGKGKKNTQKSLYGERDIASKKPLLSPIPELPEGNEMTPSGPGFWSTCSGDRSALGLEDARASDAARRRNLFPVRPDLQVPTRPHFPPDSPAAPAPEAGPRAGLGDGAPEAESRPGSAGAPEPPEGDPAPRERPRGPELAAAGPSARELCPGSESTEGASGKRERGDCAAEGQRPREQGAGDPRGEAPTAEDAAGRPADADPSSRPKRPRGRPPRRPRCPGPAHVETRESHGPGVHVETAESLGPPHGPDVHAGPAESLGPPHGPGIHAGPAEILGPPHGPGIGSGSSESLGSPHGPGVHAGSSESLGPPHGPGVRAETSESLGPPHGPGIGAGSSESLGSPHGPGIGAGSSESLGPPHGPGVHAGSAESLGSPHGPGIGAGSSESLGPPHGPGVHAGSSESLGSPHGPGVHAETSESLGPPHGPGVHAGPTESLGPPHGPGVHAGPTESLGPPHGPGVHAGPTESLGPPHGPGVDAARLCQELAEAMEQSLCAAGVQPRVRRSSRLQRDSCGQGLVWVPAPPASRRRTVGAVDSGGPGAPGGGTEERPPAVPIPVPPQRWWRRSCSSTLASAPEAPQPLGRPRPRGRPHQPAP
ncbi:cell division cycle-associated protein 2 isoform X2 [Dipodomys merriami]|uniref:cell division cycle-associated protein 2 isoform X2 n=1 Tax=Dipodomys merriami TaxID=94247 RepID=UPI00384F343C